MTTEKPEPRLFYSHRPTRDTAHLHFTDNSRVTIRETWTIDDAADGLITDWLNPHVTRDDEQITPEAHHRRAAERARRIVDSAGKVIGVLVSEQEWREGRDAYDTLNSDMYGQKFKDYMPYLHAPDATPDRLVDTTQLEKAMTKLVHGDAEPTKEERDRIHMWAFVATVEMKLVPDSRGLIPVMTPARATDSAHHEYVWSFLYPTPVAGMFVRPNDTVWGLDYALTTGGGYVIFAGIESRDHAEQLAVKLAEALPGCDWFTAREDTFTNETRQTAIDIIKAHGRWAQED